MKRIETFLKLGILMMLGILMYSIPSFMNASTSQSRYFIDITHGRVRIGSDANDIDLGASMISNSIEILTGTFGADSFWLEDKRGSEYGYYTTLQATDLVGINNANHVIPKENIYLKSTALHTIDGVEGEEAGISMGLSSGEYVSMGDIVGYISRQGGEVGDAGRLGKYGDEVQIKLEIPAFTIGDSYVGTLIYTLYDLGEKDMPRMGVKANNVLYGDEAEIVLDMSRDAEGTVTIKLDNEVIAQNLPISGGKVNYSIPNLGLGEYNVEVIYGGDDIYLSGSTTTKFIVSEKLIPTIDLHLEDTVYGQTAQVVAELNVNTGVGTIELSNGTVLDDIEVVDGVVMYDMPNNLPAGEYVVQLTYLENGSYYESVETGSFTVYKATPTLTVQTGASTVSGCSRVIINSDTIGQVNLILDGEIFQSGIMLNGVSTGIDICDINAGIHVVEVAYPGDSNHNSKSANLTIGVVKNETTISVSAQNTTTISTGVITAQVRDSNNDVVTSGAVAISVDGKIYYVPIVNGVAQLEVDGLSARTHAVIARYLGDDMYNPSTSQATFTVSKVPSTVTVNAEDIEYGQTAILDIAVTTGAQGTVTVEIGSEYSQIIGVSEGIMHLTIPGLTVGNKTVNVTYNGDGRYGESTGSTTFEVTPGHVDMDLRFPGTDKKYISDNHLVDNWYDYDRLGVYHYGENVEILATPRVEGSVTIEFEEFGIIDTTTIRDGVVDYEIPGLPAGEYVLKLTYHGQPECGECYEQYGCNCNDSYLTTVKTGKIIVLPVEPEIDVQVDDIVYGDVEYLVIDANAEGTVTVKVDGTVEQEVPLNNGRALIRLASTHRNVPQYNGIATVEIEGLSAGMHTVDVLFNGNDNYTTGLVTKTFEVKKQPVTAVFDMESVVYFGEMSEQNLILSSAAATGYATLHMRSSGDNYLYTETQPLRSGATLFNRSGAEPGVYVATLSYTGDANHYLVGDEYGFNEVYLGMIEVLSNQVNMDISYTTGVVGNKISIDITFSEDATGLVNVNCGGGNYTGAVSGGKAIVEIASLPSGVYNCEVEYLGGGGYGPATETFSFDISKSTSSVSIDTYNTTTLSGETIRVYVGDDATGAVIINVDGHDYYTRIVSGYATLTLNNLDNKTYTVHASYLGNEKYNPSEGQATFTVSKLPSTVTVNVEDVIYGDTVEISAETNLNNGVLKVYLGGNMIGEIWLTGNTVSYDIPNLSAGEYELSLVYEGNNQYDSTIATGSFRVDKATPIMIIEGVTVDANASPIIRVIINNDVSGILNITVNDKDYTAPIIGGVAVFMVDKLPVGEYDIVANYAGDDNYTGEFGTLVDGLSVVKVADYPISVSASGAKVGENTLITVVVPEDATGTIYCEVNGSGAYGSVGEGGVTTFNVKHDVAGKYSVMAVLNDNKYDRKYVYSDYFVDYADSEILISVIDFENGTDIVQGDDMIINVEITGNEMANTATGNVVINVGGESYVRPLSGGYTSLILPGYDSVGTQLVTVIYGGNESMNGSWNTATFTVGQLPKRPSTLIVEVSDINTLQSAIIKVHTLEGGPHGGVLFAVDGKSYYSEINGGYATLSLDNLVSGTHVVEVKYLGDENFLESYGQATFTVSKVPSTVTVNAEDIEYGQTAILDIAVTTGAQGTVTVEIGSEYSQIIGVTEGIMHLTIPGLTVGNKTVNVSYNGDSKFLGSTGSTTFTVSKTDPEMTLIVPEELEYGEMLLLKAIIRATGNGTIRIDDGWGYGWMEMDTVDIVNGELEYDIPNLSAGEYDIMVEFNGNDNYNTGLVTGHFVVNKVEPEIDVQVDDITYGDTGIVEIRSNAEGTVTVKVDGTGEQEVPLNNGRALIRLASTHRNVPQFDGMATVEISGLSSGMHTVEVLFNGNENYTTGLVTKTFEVVGSAASKVPTSMRVFSEVYGNEVTITVSDLPSEATSYCVVWVEGTEYGIDITKTKSVTISVRSPSEIPGEYNFVVRYLGDDIYLGSVATGSFFVDKNELDLDVDIKDTYINGNDVLIGIEAPEDFPYSEIVATVGDLTKTVSIGGGKSTIVFPGVPLGNHDVTITFSGNDYYLPGTWTGSTRVINSIIADQSLSRGRDSDYDYKATFLDKDGHVFANREVQFIIQGKTYTVTTDKYGTAYLAGGLLHVGVHDILIINPVTGEQFSSQVTIVKRLIENSNITMDFGDGSKYIVTAIGDDGTPISGEIVDIYVDGTYYAVKTNGSGHAKFEIDLNPGTYSIRAEYKGTTVANRIVVKQKGPIGLIYDDDYYIKLIEVWSNGKSLLPDGPVTLVVDGIIVDFDNDVEHGYYEYDTDNLGEIGNGLHSAVMIYWGENNSNCEDDDFYDEYEDYCESRQRVFTTTFISRDNIPQLIVSENEDEDGDYLITHIRFSSNSDISDGFVTLYIDGDEVNIVELRDGSFDYYVDDSLDYESIEIYYMGEDDENCEDDDFYDKYEDYCDSSPSWIYES